HGLKDIVAIEQALDHRQIRPDFRFEHAAIGLEYTDHRPAAGGEGHDLANFKPLKLAQQGLANYDLVGPRIEHATRDDLDAPAQLGALLADAAQRQIGLGLARAFDAVDHQVELGRDQRLAVAAAGDARALLEQAHLITRHRAVDFGL